ncbi:MAG: paraquat-inducible protein A [Deltaproteobacteria bacterium]|nr:paraquat-inducible protein A [Deltaproteobacteria bacterium]
MTGKGGFLTARAAGLVLCDDCHKLMPCQNQAGQRVSFCPRCGASVHMRKPQSLSRTWALVITAVILSLPANMLPIMQVDRLGASDYSTIMDGIIYFFEEGSYGIGIIILTASVLVPCFKIFGIMLILLSIHYKWKSWLRHKTLLFRIIEFVGRWSMLDIFVIALLQVLVSFGYLSSVASGPAATYFAGVVLSTMLAAVTFDPRLLWDA